MSDTERVIAEPQAESQAHELGAVVGADYYCARCGQWIGIALGGELRGGDPVCPAQPYVPTMNLSSPS